MSESWRDRFRSALAAGECTTSAEWAGRHPGVHCWFRFSNDDIDSCAVCGTVRRRDDRNAACRGVVKVALRGQS